MYIMLKQLKVTSTECYSPFFPDDNITTLVEHKESYVVTNVADVKYKTAYLHGNAEDLAGFDIPVFMDGDMRQLDLPVDEQDIVLMLPSGQYNCKSVVNIDKIDGTKQYYITLK